MSAVVCETVTPESNDTSAPCTAKTTVPSASTAGRVIPPPANPPKVWRQTMFKSGSTFSMNAVVDARGSVVGVPDDDEVAIGGRDHRIGASPLPERARPEVPGQAKPTRSAQSRGAADAGRARCPVDVLDTSGAHLGSGVRGRVVESAPASSNPLPSAAVDPDDEHPTPAARRRMQTIRPGMLSHPLTAQLDEQAVSERTRLEGRVAALAATPPRNRDGRRSMGPGAGSARFRCSATARKNRPGG